ncbi:MAG: hypothetical protein GX442_21225 [Candidatus Riflebacteria bacterium]|nr:hypothetical protein [Candidatus Riflebacteria bacterium]
MSELTSQLIIQLLKLLIIIYGWDPAKVFQAAAARFGVSPGAIRAIWENR